MLPLVFPHSLPFPPISPMHPFPRIFPPFSQSPPPSIPPGGHSSTWASQIQAPGRRGGWGLLPTDMNAQTLPSCPLSQVSSLEVPLVKGQRDREVEGGTQLVIGLLVLSNVCIHALCVLRILVTSDATGRFALHTLEAWDTVIGGDALEGAGTREGCQERLPRRLLSVTNAVSVGGGVKEEIGWAAGSAH